MSAFRPPALESFAYGSAGLSLGPMTLDHGARALPGGAAKRLAANRLTSKRLADVVLSCVFLALAVLPMLAIAAAIRLTSPGPALFRQRRVGLNGQAFT